MCDTILNLPDNLLLKIGKYIQARNEFGKCMSYMIPRCHSRLALTIGTVNPPEGVKGTSKPIDYVHTKLDEIAFGSTFSLVKWAMARGILKNPETGEIDHNKVKDVICITGAANNNINVIRYGDLLFYPLGGRKQLLVDLLHAQVRYDNLENFNVILNKEPNTSLALCPYIAAQFGSMKVMPKLRAVLDSNDTSVWHPKLYLAAIRGGHLSVVEWLNDAGVPMTDECQIEAVRCGQKDIFDYVAEHMGRRAEWLHLHAGETCHDAVLA